MAFAISPQGGTGLELNWSRFYERRIDPNLVQSDRSVNSSQVALQRRKRLCLLGGQFCLFVSEITLFCLKNFRLKIYLACDGGSFHNEPFQ